MKRIILFFSLLFFIFFTSKAQSIDWEAVKNRYTEKYQPEEIPTWLFPIIFRDATGARDTVYYGYDEDATLIFPNDTMFQEVFLPADPDIFNAYWGNACNQCDTFSLVDINIIDTDFVFSEIQFINSTLPVTMYFDASFLEDPILPFPDIPENPDVQIDVAFTSPLVTENSIMTNICPFERATITDSILAIDFIEHCVYTDSIIFTNDPDFPLTIMPPLGIRLMPWTGQLWVSISEPEIELSIYPNPVNDFLHIELDEEIQGTIKLLDLKGRIYYTYQLNQMISYNIPVSTIPNGMYLFYLETEKFVLLRKILVLH